MRVATSSRVTALLLIMAVASCEHAAETPKANVVAQLPSGVPSQANDTPGGTIGGVVVNSRGSPVPGALIAINALSSNRNNLTPVGVGSAGSKGEFQVEKIP